MKGITQKQGKKLNNNNSDFILQLLFWVSMVLVIWGINIYRITIIDIKYLTFTVVIGATIAFLIIQKTLKSSYSPGWIIFISVGIGGGIMYFGLLFINQQFADKALLAEECMILETGTLAGGRSSSCAQPFATVDFNGTEKELLFYCQDAEMLKRATKVNVTYSTGAFGFEVVQSKQPVE